MFKHLSCSVTGDVVSCELSHVIDLMRSDTFTKSSQKQVFPLSSHLGDTTWQLFGLLNWGRGLKAGFSGHVFPPNANSTKCWKHASVHSWSCECRHNNTTGSLHTHCIVSAPSHFLHVTWTLIPLHAFLMRCFIVKLLLIELLLRNSGKIHVCQTDLHPADWGRRRGGQLWQLSVCVCVCRLQDADLSPTIRATMTFL